MSGNKRTSNQVTNSDPYDSDEEDDPANRRRSVLQPTIATGHCPANNLTAWDQGYALHVEDTLNLLEETSNFIRNVAYRGFSTAAQLQPEVSLTELRQRLETVQERLSHARFFYRTALPSPKTARRSPPKGS